MKRGRVVACTSKYVKHFTVIKIDDVEHFACSVCHPGGVLDAEKRGQVGGVYKCLADTKVSLKRHLEKHHAHLLQAEVHEVLVESSIQSHVARVEGVSLNLEHLVWFAEDTNLAPGCVDRTSFRVLMAPAMSKLGFSDTSRSTLRRALPRVSDDIRMGIRQAIADQLICVMVDGGTVLRVKFLNFTIGVRRRGFFN
jgi:hypothetical protein